MNDSRRPLWEARVRTWTAVVGVVLALFLTDPRRARAQGQASAHCADSEHQALLSRLERLEALVVVLQQRLEVGMTVEDKSSAVLVQAEFPAPPQGPEGVAPAAQLFNERARYLPSRGRNAEWMKLAESVLDLRAYLDLEYIDAGSEGSRGGVSTFDNHHVQVFLQSLIRPNLLAHAELEWEHSGDEVEVDQAYVSWALTDTLSLDFGRFYTPFGIERFVWYSPTNTLVSRPLAHREIVPGNFYANGIKASGIFGQALKRSFSYELAISDGLGENALADRRGSRQNRDNNSSRALSGRVGFSPSSLLEFGASYHGQRYSSEGNLKLRFLAFDATARWRGFEMRTEFIEAVVDEPARGDLEQQGWYTQLSYSWDWDRLLLPSLTLVSRFDDLDLDRDLRSGDDRRSWSLGVSVEVLPQFRLKGEVQRTTEEGPNLENDAFFLQAVVDF